MIVRRFEVKDLDAIEKFDDMVTKEQLIELYDKSDDESMFVTFVEDDEVIAISGIKHLYGDVGEVFNLRTKHLRARHIREMKPVLHKYAKLFDRVQTVSDPEWAKWHKAMGFEKEATMRKFMHGKDYELWVIINGCD